MSNVNAVINLNGIEGVYCEDGYCMSKLIIEKRNGKDIELSYIKYTDRNKNFLLRLKQMRYNNYLLFITIGLIIVFIQLFFLKKV